MKVLLHSDLQDAIAKSGVGRAQDHQKLALSSAGIPYTTDPKDNYDLIQINTIFPQSYLMSKRARRKGIPIIYFAHSTAEDFKDSYILSSQTANGFKWWLKKCYSTADLILTPTDYSKQLLDSYQIGVPIKTMSNGIDLNYWQASATEIAEFKEYYNIAQDMPTVISVGLQIKRKGIIDFVEMAKRMPDVQFIWFGKSNPNMVTKDVQQALNTSLPNLNFAGYIPRDQLRIAYQVADLYVFLTHEETEGIVLLEALASKTLTLVRDLPVFDYLENNKHVYKAKNISEFIASAQNILNKTWPNLTGKGYEIAQERSIETIGQRYKTIYQQILDRVKSPN